MTRRSGLWTVARLTLRETARRRIVLGTLLLAAGYVLVFGLGLFFMHREFTRDPVSANANPLIRSQLYNMLLMTGLYGVNLVYAVMAVLISLAAISGDISTGTVQAVAARPIRRSSILLGKWLGLLILLTVYFLLLAGGTLLVSWLITGYTLPNVFRGLALIGLAGVVMLHVSLLGGTRLPTLGNGALVLGLFGIAFAGGWVEQIGSFVNNAAAVRIGVVTSLMLPTEALWKRAAWEMRSPLVDAAGFSPFTSSNSTPSTAMIVYAVVFAVGVLALAVRWFGKRDL